MFEPKNYVEQRLVMCEAILNQIVGMARMKAEGEELEMLNRLMGQWEYHGHIAKKNEAMRVLGIGTLPEGPEVATRQWIQSIVRHNFGILEVFGNGRYNPDPRLPGNDSIAYEQWLAALESPGQVVRDTRPSEYFKDGTHLMAGMPVLKLVTQSPRYGTQIHLILLFEGITVQSLSVDHLPSSWNWDASSDGWRAEVFSYLNTMDKETFLRELARAIQVSRSEFWGEDLPVLFVPEDDGEAIQLAKKVTDELGMTYKAITTIDAEIPDGGAESEEVIPGFGQVEEAVSKPAPAAHIPSDQADTGDC